MYFDNSNYIFCQFKWYCISYSKIIKKRYNLHFKNHNRSANYFYQLVRNLLRCPSGFILKNDVVHCLTFWAKVNFVQLAPLAPIKDCRYYSHIFKDVFSSYFQNTLGLFFKQKNFQEIFILHRSLYSCLPHWNLCISRLRSENIRPKNWSITVLLFAVHIFSN